MEWLIALAIVAGNAITVLVVQLFGNRRQKAETEFSSGSTGSGVPLLETKAESRHLLGSGICLNAQFIQLLTTNIPFHIVMWYRFRKSIPRSTS